MITCEKLKFAPLKNKWINFFYGNFDNLVKIPFTPQMGLHNLSIQLNKSSQWKAQQGF